MNEQCKERLKRLAKSYGYVIRFTEWVATISYNYKDKTVIIIIDVASESVTAYYVDRIPIKQYPFSLSFGFMQDIINALLPHVNINEVV